MLLSFRHFINKKIHADDDYFNRYCIECDKKGDRKKTKVYSENHELYLCGTCYKKHIGRTEDTCDEDILANICSLHEGEVIRYYCKTHEAVVCYSCMIIEHKPCQEICVLSDVARNVEQSTLYKQFCTRMETLNTCTNIEDQIQTAKENVKINGSCLQAAIFNMDEIQMIIEKMERDITKKRNHDLNDFQCIEESAIKVKDTLNTLKNSFQVLEETEQREQLFIAMNRNNKKLESLEQEVEDIRRKNEEKKNSFVQNKFLVSRLDDALGELRLHGETETQINLGKRFYENNPKVNVHVPRSSTSMDKLILLETTYAHVRMCVKEGQEYDPRKTSPLSPWDF